MCIDTTASKTWNPFPPLIMIVVWLALVGFIAFAVCSGGCNPPAPPASGSITLTWSIADPAGQPTTCDQVGARSVALRLTNRATGGVVSTAFPCGNSPGTATIAPGSYNIVIELHAPDGTKLATAPPQDNVAIVAGQIKRLAPVTFVSAQSGGDGRLVLSIGASTAATNCQSAEAGGAGISSTTITLVHTGDGCEPVTFARSVGGTSRGTYTVDCSTPIVATCIEKTETLTTSLPPGSYTVHVVGKINANDCWQGEDILQVPPPGTPLIHTVALTRQARAGC